MKGEQAEGGILAPLLRREDAKRDGSPVRLKVMIYTKRGGDPGGQKSRKELKMKNKET